MPSDQLRRLAEEFCERGTVNVDDLAELLIKVDREAREECAKIAEPIHRTDPSAKALCRLIARDIRLSSP